MKTHLVKFLAFVLDIPGRAFWRVRKAAIVPRFRSVGKNFSFDPKTSVFSSETISIGDDVFVGQYAYFGGEISIGSNVMFGRGVTILGANHLFGVFGKSTRFLRPIMGENLRPVIIEDEVWIGANVNILGGTCIGMGAVVGAAALVNSDVPPYTLSVGNPCRSVRKIFDDKTLEDHLTAIGCSVEKAKEVVKRREELLAGQRLQVLDQTRR